MLNFVKYLLQNSVFYCIYKFLLFSLVVANHLFDFPQLYVDERMLELPADREADVQRTGGGLRPNTYHHC